MILHSIIIIYFLDAAVTRVLYIILLLEHKPDRILLLKDFLQEMLNEVEAQVQVLRSYGLLLWRTSTAGSRGALLQTTIPRELKMTWTWVPPPDLVKVRAALPRVVLIEK